MPGPLHFAPLGSADAPLIGALQRQLFPPELTETDAFIAELLRNTEQHQVCNLSFGLFDGPRMVGYVFAYVETRSLFHGRDEDVIYIKEIALLPGHEGRMRDLFGRLVAQWQAFVPGIALEAHAMSAALANWRRLERAFRFYGLTLSAREEAAKEGRPPYWLMRLDVTSQAAHLLERVAPLPVERMDHAAGLSTCVVTSPRQWLALRPLWEQIATATNAGEVQQHFGFLWQWWRNFGTWLDLHLVVVMRGEEPVAVAPLMLRHVRVGGAVLRRLELLGSPDLGAGGALLPGRVPAGSIAALLAHLDAHGSEWDVLEIVGQRDEALDALLAHAARGGWLALRHSDGIAETDMSASNATRVPAPGGKVRRIDSWPALDAGLDLHCTLEDEGVHEGARVALNADRDRYFFYLSLARQQRDGMRFVQHVHEDDRGATASRFGLLTNSTFHLARLARAEGRAGEDAAAALAAAERQWLREQGVRRIEYAVGEPADSSSRVQVERIQFWQPRHRDLHRRAAWRWRLAAVLDAISIGGAGRGQARRLRAD